MTGWLGIDVSKATLAGAEAETGVYWQLPNTPAGWRALTARYADDPPAGVVMEATGALHVGLHLHLVACGWHSSVLNPSRTAAYAASQGRLGKTDRADARLLARYGARERPPVTPVTSPAQQRVMALMRRRAQVVKLRVMNTNQAGAARSDEIVALCETLTAACEAQIAELDARIAAILATDPELAALSRQLQSMPGIGPVTSTWLICALPELADRDRRQLAALAGVAPHPRQSGQRARRGRVRGGRPDLTRALFVAARVAIRHDPYFRDYFARYMGRPGKSYKMGVIAVANKMLTLLAAMVRQGLGWTETDAYRRSHPTPPA